MDQIGNIRLKQQHKRWMAFHLRALQTYFAHKHNIYIFTAGKA